MEGAASTRVTFRTVDGQEKELRAFDIYRAYPANDLVLARPRAVSTRAACGASWPTSRARRTPRAASSRPSSAP